MYIAFSGPPRCNKKEAAANVAERLGAVLVRRTVNSKLLNAFYKDPDETAVKINEELSEASLEVDRQVATALAEGEIVVANGSFRELHAHIDTLLSLRLQDGTREVRFLRDVDHHNLSLRYGQIYPELINPDLQVVITDAKLAIVRRYLERFGENGKISNLRKAFARGYIDLIVENYRRMFGNNHSTYPTLICLKNDADLTTAGPWCERLVEEIIKPFFRFKRLVNSFVMLDDRPMPDKNTQVEMPAMAG